MIRFGEHRGMLREDAMMEYLKIAQVRCHWDIIIGVVNPNPVRSGTFLLDSDPELLVSNLDPGNNKKRPSKFKFFGVLITVYGNTENTVECS